MERHFRTHYVNIWLLLLLLLPLIFLVTCQPDNRLTKDHKRSFRCPPSNERNCSSSKPVTTCVTDNDCLTGGDTVEICCHDSCDSQQRTCTVPIMTACEHRRLSTEKRARALKLESSIEDVENLSCTSDGRFEPVQCNSSGHCWCIDQAGFEIGGTRVRSREFINCSAPRPCAGHLCRMLCPFEFELDTDGCPMCRCRDPCQGVRCPRGTNCQLEDVVCEQEPCPPVPTCKQPRSLDDVCPVGKALTVSDTDKAFLCGLEPTKPQCPMYFSCEIQPNMDYGVCCPSTDHLTKPGTCPANFTNCAGLSGCQHDMECEGLHKCCPHQTCGQVCVQMAENTRCLQQKILSELLSVREKSGQGYIPQCAPDGEFERRQCSRNGLICWCVDVNGFKLPRSMGPANQVECPLNEAQDARPRDCEHIRCSNSCPYGYKEDEDGCPNCQCVDPCDNIKCPSQMECVLVINEFCGEEEEDSSCDADTYPICKPPPILYSKPGTCPTSAQKPFCNSSSEPCKHDRDCPDDLKCCLDINCHSGQCVTPIRASQRLPTMCEYLRDFQNNTVDLSRALQVALPAPLCRPDGGYQRMQCHDGQCWCVDEFGTEISGSRSREKINCETQLRNKGCDGLLCRLGCDYGFRYGDDDGCPVCECRSPCDGVKCKDGEECQLIEVDCFGGFCPSVPQCLPTESSVTMCPIGEPIRHSFTNASRSCAIGSSCPSGYFCSSTDTNTMEGVCCKKTVKAGQCPYRFPLRFGHCEGQSQCDSDHHCPGAKKCCSDGCMSTCVEPEIKTACEHKAAVSEYMINRKSVTLGQIHVPECENEDGAYSTVQCEVSSTSGLKYCWCVDDHGREAPFTRSVHAKSEAKKVNNCSVSDTTMNSCRNLTDECPLTRCEHGHRFDSNGCRTCDCHDPCEDFLCSKKNEECRLITVRCVTQPCPTIPMCVNKNSNPCPFGEPLQNGPRCSSLPNGSTCPSSHVCLHSPLDHFQSTCCPKPRDVCLKEADHGTCSTGTSAKPHRWHFNLKRNRCELSPGDKCSMSINGFADRFSCEATCPPLTDCERAREKANQLSKKNSGFAFVPKCKKDGGWEVTQCLPQLGLCWCVTSQGGEYIKGTAIRGIPRCGGPSWRMGRKLDDATELFKSPHDVSVCPDGSAVHFCNASACDGKVCLADVEATCRVNPCGGCHLRFYSNDELVDCERGLSECQKEVQMVINSDVWQRQTGSHSISTPTSGNHLLDVSMMVLPPRCTADGRYEAVQSQGELEWCVDRDGIAVEGSLTRGKVTCDAKGKLIQRLSRGPVCPDENQKPMVCHYECHNITCPAHPDAICTADPCSSCKVTFVSSSGERVHCEEKCRQPMDRGMCRAAFPRWHHNVTSNKCEEFVYGGCSGNDNNFDSRESCESECHNKALSVCEQPKRIGSCRASMKRWWFDKNSQKCQQFIYGGCEGNENNFESKHQCESTCPDIVLCPRLDLLRTSPVACVRSVLCFNKTCPLDHDAYCTVEPCDCSVHFVNSSGQRVSCHNETISTTTVSTDVEVSSEDPSTKFSRCEELRAIGLATGSSSIPLCNLKGDFESTQCDVNDRCWCVDEAGNRLEKIDKTFRKGTQQCPLTIVDSISVKLLFPNNNFRSVSKLKSLLIKRAVSKWLTRLVPSVTVSNVSVAFTPNDIKMEFIISGENSIEAGALLQQKMTKDVELTLDLDADDSVAFRGGTSIIEHHLAGVSEFEDANSNKDGSSYLTTTTVVILVVMGSLVALLAVFLLLYILLHKRRSQGYFPQSSCGGSVCSEITSSAVNKTMYGTEEMKSSPQIPFWSIPENVQVTDYQNPCSATSLTVCNFDPSRPEDEHVYEPLRYRN